MRMRSLILAARSRALSVAQRGRQGILRLFSRLPPWAPKAAIGAGVLIALGYGVKSVMTKMSIAEAMARVSAFLREHGVEDAVGRAIMQIESGGRTGLVNGRVLIRFEPASFKERSGLPANVIPLLPGMSAPTGPEGRKRTGGQAAEWATLARAIALNENIAYETISMGPYQIMGFNHNDAGYASAAEMLRAYGSDPASAHLSFIKFLTKYKNGRVLTAMKNKDFVTVALLYNGDRTGRYARAMQEEYNRFA